MKKGGVYTHGNYDYNRLFPALRVLIPLLITTQEPSSSMFSSLLSSSERGACLDMLQEGGPRTSSKSTC